MTVPRFQPMLATRWPGPFTDPEWSFEVKWDGVRTLLYWDGRDVELRSRTGREVTSRYPEVVPSGLPKPAVIDGEIVAFDAAGRPSFGLLQGRMNLTGAGRIAAAATETPVAFMAFDLLYRDGVDLTSFPWEERRARLEALVLEPPLVTADVMTGSGDSLWEFVEDRSLEGMVAKRHGSPYRPGVRSPDWRKIARVQQMRAVVGGFTPGEGGRSSTFGALLLGLVTDEGLRWVGAVGTGFNERALQEIRAALDEMAVADSPFIPDPELPRDAIWVEPVLVAVVEFKEWTVGPRLRAPSFKGFGDVPAAAVTWEAEGPDR